MIRRPRRSPLFPSTPLSRSMTAPTRGFGATRPQPRHARSRARRIADRSAGRSESEAEADASEDMPRLGIEVIGFRFGRSEEHTSELQSPCNLVCRLLLEKKK